MKRLVRHKFATEAAAERFVKNNSTLNRDGWLARWNGWTVETFIPNPAAVVEPRGTYDRTLGVWGYVYSFPPNSKGEWNVKVPVTS